MRVWLFLQGKENTGRRECLFRKTLRSGVTFIFLPNILVALVTSSILKGFLQQTPLAPAGFSTQPTALPLSGARHTVPKYSPLRVEKFDVESTRKGKHKIVAPP